MERGERYNGAKVCEQENDILKSDPLREALSLQRAYEIMMMRLFAGWKGARKREKTIDLL